MNKEQVLADLWVKKASGIRRAAKRTLRDRDAADDVTARSFVRLAEALTAGTVANVEGLLTTISKNLIVDEQRAAYRRPVPAGLEVVEPGTNGNLPASLTTFPHEFDAAIRTLPDEQRAAYILTELRGLTVREAASVLGTSKSTVARAAEAAITSRRKELD